ncbi:MAG: protein translocase subunit SecD [Patescibacteria group bacterium]
MKLSNRQKLWLTLAGIFVLAVIAGLVDYPKGPDITWKGNIVKELKVHLGLDLQGGTSLVYEADLSQVDSAEQEEAMNGVRDVIERRINAFGVSEPNIQTNQVGEHWRVIIELPGITDINEAVKQIGETPLLQFKEEGEITQEQTDIINSLNVQNKVKAEELLATALKTETDFSQLAKDNSQDPGSKDNDGDLGYFSKGDMVAEFDDVVFNKAEVGQVYPKLVETDYGWHIIKLTDKRTNSTTNELEAEASHILIPKLTTDAFGTNYIETELTGKQLKRADVIFDNQTNLPQVALEFDAEGKTLFADITSRNVDKTVAIYLDGSAISTPVVDEAITDGLAVISGDFTLDEAKTLVIRLNSGALPVPIELINQRNIGPTLGQASIENSLLAAIIGLIILSIFMIVYYRLPGFMAVISLFIYGLIVLAIFKLWPITLTLSGIAGFILSIGMAVDANVLIFERMREEIRFGKPLASSIDDGFNRAWPSIRDSNISSLITCIILYWVGTSIVKGFAVTLTIGILISMFSAIIITKNLLKIFNLKNYWLYGVNKKNQD